MCARTLVQALVDQLRLLPNIVKLGVATLLAGIQETMFVTKSVEELTFAGYADQFGDIVRQIAKFVPPPYRQQIEAFLTQLPPRIGFFYGVCVCLYVFVYTVLCSKTVHPTIRT